MTITDRSNSQVEPAKQEPGNVETVDSVFYGHLTAVDFSANTALLERSSLTYDIKLEFTSDLLDDFRLFAGKYVRVSGDAEYASYEDGGDLVSPLRVRLIQDLTPGSGTPDPRTEPKIFDPSKARKADWDFDAEGFIQIIKEGRNGLQ